MCHLIMSLTASQCLNEREIMKLTPSELVRWNNQREKERMLGDRKNDPTFNPDVKRQKMDTESTQSEPTGSDK